MSNYILIIMIIKYDFIDIYYQFNDILPTSVDSSGKELDSP